MEVWRVESHRLLIMSFTVKDHVSAQRHIAGLSMLLIVSLPSPSTDYVETRVEPISMYSFERERENRRSDLHSVVLDDSILRCSAVQER